MSAIPYVNLAAQWEAEGDELLPLIKDVLSRGDYVGGEAIEKFEHSVAKYCGTRYAIALNSGTDALTCALHGLGIGKGDEVITPPNSFIASTAAIIHVGARPIFVDVLPDQNIDPNLIEASITKNTRAIMPVHLTGRMARMDAICEIAERHQLVIVEDAAQSIGSRWRESLSGSVGAAGCFSTHPLKNLNACGDGGFVTTDDRDLAERIRSMRNHGLVNRNTVEAFGMVSRMDTIQAEILSFRLKKLDGVIRARRRNAALYRTYLDHSRVFIPDERKEEFNSYHTFVIQLRDRDLVRRELLIEGIQTAIHYPSPIHLQPAAQKLGYTLGDFPVTERQMDSILTLPIHQFLTEVDVARVADSINRRAGLKSNG